MLATVAKQVPERRQAVERLAPTPEQQRRGNFVKVATDTSRGAVNAVAYRREPLFETLAKGQTGIDAEGLAALRYYRNRHE